MMSSNHNDQCDLLKFSILNPKLDWPLLEDTYSLWYDVWQFTLIKELKSRSKVSSDAFMNSQEIATLWLEHQVVAMIFLNWYDLKYKAVQDLDYFSHYPSQSLRSIISNGYTRVMTSTYLTVNPEYRRSTNFGAPLADIMIGLAIKQFLASGADGALAVTRNDRKVNEIFFRFGGIKIGETSSQHNVPVDLVLVPKSFSRESQDQKVRSIIDRLWLLWTNSTSNLQSAA